MKTPATFTNAGWNFTTIWGCNPAVNDGYPFLRFSGNTDTCSPVLPVVEAGTPRSSSGGSSGTRTKAKAPDAVVAPLSPRGTTNQTPLLSSAVRDLVLKNRSLFEAAQQAGIALPTLITDILASGNATTTVTTAVIPVRDLFRGMSGEDVRALQVMLINHNAGPKALELKRVTATSFFINYTEEALIEYQTKYGIMPATGYFGPASRAQMKAAGLPGLWW